MERRTGFCYNCRIFPCQGCGPVPATRVKICGITSLQDALAAVACGADAIGFIMYRGSSRYVAPELAAEILAGLPAFVTSVGVFVDEPMDSLNAIVRQAPFDLLQFHGDETPDYCARAPRPYIRAARATGAAELSRVAAVCAGARGILLDTVVDGRFGGTGQVFDWSMAPRLPLPMIVAGGLNAANVCGLVRRLRPHGVDVSSGVECAGGAGKDPVRMKAFVEAVAAADRAAS